MNASYTLSPAQAKDEPFLLEVYASTRADELALVGWSAKQKQVFVQMQFNAQRQHYLAYYPGAEYSIILREHTPLGRLIVDRSGVEILLMDIALLPEYRRAGIGAAIIQSLQAEASQAGKPLRLHVEIYNPAQRLYARLGFSKIDAVGIYEELEWRSDN